MRDEIEIRAYSQWDLMSNRQRIHIVLFMIFIMPPLFWGMIALLEVNFNNKRICGEFKTHAFMCPTEKQTTKREIE